MQLAARALTVELGGRVVVDRVDLDAVDGAVLGLLGPNGCGKSTIVRALTGSLPIRSGSVTLDGRELQSWNAKEIAQRVALVPQEPPTIAGLSVAEVVLLGRNPHRRDHQSFALEDRRIAAEALDTVGCDHLAQRRWNQLSGGERQRVHVARCLAQGAEILVLDEPTNHLDVRFQHEVLSLVRSRGLTTLVVLHDLNLAAQFCDQVALMSVGSILDVGPTDAVLDPAVLSEIYQIEVVRLVDGERSSFAFGTMSARSGNRRSEGHPVA